MNGNTEETPQSPQRRERTSKNDSAPAGREGETSDETLPMPTPQGAPIGPTPRGQRLPASFGRYQVREFRGQGGFGEVYIGFDPQLNRVVAIKTPRLQGKEAEQKFLLEARQLAQMRHPGIVTVYDAGIQDERIYLVTDYLRGVTLHAWLNAHRPSWREAAGIAARIADALAYAHAHRTVHRDVKPENIIMQDGKNPILVDFGLALSDEASSAGELGYISGTPLYMSPEQAAGKGHRIDGRTDIYSLGVVLYRLLCGRLPFHAPVLAELFRQVREDEPQPPRQLASDIPPLLEFVCLKAMAKRQEDRYTTAADMAEDLRAVLGAAVQTAVSSSARPAAEIEEARTLEAKNESSSRRRARQAERCQATVLCGRCDLFDSDAFLEKLDAEEQHEVLSEYKQICAGIVVEMDGAVVQSTGAELLACFGYPIAHEDAAQRAVRAGLRLRDKIVELQERIDRQFSIAFSIRIGIHTGMVVAEEVADDGSAEPMSLVGEARTVAARLLTAAEAGSVVVSAATQRLIQGYFSCASLGQHVVKGSAEPLELFRVVDENPAASRIEIAEAIGLTPLTGRDVEINILHDRWEKACEGMGQVVLLIGDAGLGKSRLVRELRGWVSQSGVDPSASGRGDGRIASTIEWRCSPYYQNTELYAAIRFFSRMLGFGRDDAPGERLQKLVAHLEQYHLTDPGTVALLTSLLSLPPDPRYPPLDVGPQRRQEMILETLCDWLRAVSTRQPLLFIVEDLHWADPTTVEFLQLLVSQAAGDALLAVFTFRPWVEASWKSRTPQTELMLNKLTRRQIGEMMARQTGREDLPAELVAQIVERTDGVPLFVEEFTRVLVESGALAVEQASLPVLQSIPSTLQDLLLARLHRLASVPEVVQMAAALGREFSYELLRTVSDVEESVLQEELTKLVRAEILFEKGWPPRRRYLFKHVLIQQAAYSALLKKTRRQFHRRIALVMEEKFVETVEMEPELLAHHFGEADLYEKAIFYWGKAGLRSKERSANREAIGHLTRGLELLQKLDEAPQRDALELELRAPLGVVLTAAHGWGAPEVAPAIERTRALCDKVGTISDRFFALWSLWGFRLLRLELDECRRLSAEAMRLVEGSEEGRQLLAEVHWLPGCTAYYAGDFAEARTHFEAGLAHYQDERGREHMRRSGQNARVLHQCHLSLTLWEMGWPDRALSGADDAVRWARELNHPFSLAMAHYFRRRLHQECRMEEQARQGVAEEYAICHQHGFGFWETHALFARGDFHVRQGRFDDGREQFDLALRTLGASACKCTLTHPCCYLSETFLQAGRFEEAGEWLRRGFDVVENHGERCMESELWRLKGELSARLPGGEADAEAYFERAAETARRQHSLSRRLRAAMSLYRLMPTETKQLQLSQIFAEFHEGFTSVDLIRAQKLIQSAKIG